jgi:hypothetical protein
VSDTLLGPDQGHRTFIRRFDAAFGGPVWWAMHFAGMYWWVPRACTLGAMWPFHLWTVLMFGLTMRALLSGVQVARAAAADDGGGPKASRDIFIGWTGGAFAAFFGVVILAEWVPSLTIDPCW